MNVDNDEVNGADNAITVFVNCKIFGPDADFSSGGCRGRNAGQLPEGIFERV